MSKYFIIMCSAALFLLVGFSAFAVADDHGDRVCLFKHEDFNGHQQCYRPGDSVSDLKHADIESIRVEGHARVVLYEDRDFRGRTMDFSANIPDLKRVLSGSKEFHDRVGSLRVTGDSY